MRLARYMAAGGIALFGLGAGSVPDAEAAYFATLEQVGSNVVATGSGSLDITDLSLTNSGYENGIIRPSFGVFVLGPSPGSGPAEFGPSISGPSSIGPGSGTFLADGGIGDVAGVAFGQLFVPQGYASGTPLGISTDTYSNTTLASLGVTDGTYTWTWGSGPHADSFTLQVGAVVPEPASLAVLGAGLAVLGLRRRRKTAA